MFHLAIKAFYPALPPFPLLHADPATLAQLAR
jgi:hypothetical protein